MFARKTKPHLYTWLIWAITQGTAAVALIYGGGKFGSISLIIGTVLVCVIFIFTFKYGTKNITKGDTATLVVAMLAVIVWWQLKNPLLSVLMVSAIDGIGYIPTFRKSYKEPYSETVSFWILMALAAVLSILANAEYNLLTVTYLTVLAVANIIVASICVIRRKTIVS
ncbi:MAG: hypothetical protein KBC87_00545 [Candidatus Pacebacteria bacterium]|nr:hypothetical protein [Candidatus Paceibacterota bacterium]